jgi:tetratricopeptide (TPR) repeat protein
MSQSAPGTIGVGLVGTPGYAAPEQYLSRNVDGRADLYALGVMIYEMVACRRPFAGIDPVALATSVLRDEAPRLSQSGFRVPPQLETLVGKLLERDPADRPSSGDEVLVELSPLRDLESSPLARRTVLLRKRVPTTAILAVVALFAVATGIIIYQQITRRPIGPATPVVAVLPLANMSGDATNDYLGAGLAESLITSLASRPRLTVLSRSAVDETRQQYPDRARFVQALDATYVVEGSVQAVAERLRVTLTLVRRDSSVAWGDTVEGPSSDLFALQAQLAASLNDAIEDQAPSAARVEPAGPTTASEPAQIAYWKGRALLDRRDIAGNPQLALREFEDAIRADPKFAMGYAGLAEAQWAMWSNTNDKSWADRAIESTAMARKLEPDRPAVRYSAGMTLFRIGRYDEARQELEKAIELQPTSDEATRLLGRVLMRQGRIEEGLAQFNKALAIRPNSIPLHTEMGLALFNASRYKEALEAFEKAVALAPNSSTALSQAGAAAQALGDTAKALSFFERATAIQPRAETFSNMGTIYYGQGEYAKAANAYEAALLIRPLAAQTHRNLGDAYSRLGRREDALKAYRQAVVRAQADVAVSPDDARALARLAVYQAKAGDDAAALRTLASAQKLAPRDEQAHLRAGVVHALAGRAEAALDAIQRAVAGGISPRAVSAEEDFAVLRPLPRFASMVSNPGEVKR